MVAPGGIGQGLEHQVELAGRLTACTRASWDGEDPAVKSERCHGVPGWSAEPHVEAPRLHRSGWSISEGDCKPTTSGRCTATGHGLLHAHHERSVAVDAEVRRRGRGLCCTTTRLGLASGSPLILLCRGRRAHPGYLGDLAGLSQQHQLVLPHLRGVGRSRAAGLETMGSRWRQADDIDRLRAHLELARCAIAAHSAGTRLAIAYAAEVPDAREGARPDHTAGGTSGRRGFGHPGAGRASDGRAAVRRRDRGVARRTRHQQRRDVQCTGNRPLRRSATRGGTRRSRSTLAHSATRWPPLEHSSAVTQPPRPTRPAAPGPRTDAGHRGRTGHRRRARSRSSRLPTYSRTLAQP